jgi:hypothetical protein
MTTTNVGATVRVKDAACAISAPDLKVCTAAVTIFERRYTGPPNLLSGYQGPVSFAYNVEQMCDFYPLLNGI